MKFKVITTGTDLEWHIDLNSLEELLQYHKYQKCPLIITNLTDGPKIEIYNNYRE